jgi:hypothetical protein
MSVIFRSDGLEAVLKPSVLDVALGLSANSFVPFGFRWIQVKFVLPRQLASGQH